MWQEQVQAGNEAVPTGNAGAAIGSSLEVPGQNITDAPGNVSVVSGGISAKPRLPCLWPAYPSLYREFQPFGTEDGKTKTHYPQFPTPEIAETLSPYYDDGVEIGYYPKELDFNYVKFVYKNLNDIVQKILFDSAGKIIADRRINKKQIQKLVHFRKLWDEIWSCPIDVFEYSYMEYISNDLYEHFEPPYGSPAGGKYRLTAAGKEKALRVNKVMHHLACDLVGYTYMPRREWRWCHLEHQIVVSIPFIDLNRGGKWIYFGN